MRRQQIIVFLTICLASLLSSAYPKTITVTGNIYDRRTTGHLPDTEIHILTPDSSLVAKTVASKDVREIYSTSIKTIKTGAFSVEVSDSIDKYILVASHEGFEPYSEVVDLSGLGKREFELKLPPIYLTPLGKHTDLEELVVKATKVKFYNKGDTIVYNADAFILPEGSMLDALLEQLPGVEFREGGQIYVNGKYVESLLLNGKDFFKGNQDVLRQNLGAYTVKQVEVYDKYNEMSTLMGRRIEGDSQYVMDVKLKRDYMGSFMGSAEVGIGTEDRYLGRLFGMYSNDNARFSAYLNLNNLNNIARPNAGGGYSGINVAPPGVTETANGGFDYNVEDIAKVWSVGGNIDVNYTDHRVSKDIMEESFLSGGNTYRSAFSEQRNFDLRLTTDHKFTWQKPLFYTKIMPRLSYSRHHHGSGSIDATFSENVQERMDMDREVLDAIYSSSSPKELREALVNRNRYYSLNRGNGIEGNIFSENAFKFRNSPDALSVWFETHYRGSHDDTRGWQTVDYGSSAAGGPLSSLAQRSGLSGNPSYDFMVKGSALYYIYARKFTWSFGYEFRHEQTRRTAGRMLAEARAEHEEAFVPEAEALTPDLPNTNRSKQYDNIHQLKGKMEYHHTFDSGLQFGSYVSAEYHITGRRLDFNGYERRSEGDVYMPVHIPISKTTGGFMNSYIKFALFKKDRGNMNLTYTVNTILPSLLEMVDLPNTSDPLNISLGNPDLKKATKQSFDLYARYIFRRNNYITFTMNGQYTSNDNTRGYRYDSATGVRIFRTYNTSGNWSLSPNASYYLEFGPQGQLTLNPRLGYNRSRFANMIGENSDPKKQFVTQDRYSASASLDWRTSRFGLSGGGAITDIYSKTLKDNSLHLSYINPFAGFWVAIPGGVIIGGSYNVYLKSGMADKNMNTTRHLLNADVWYSLNSSWSFSAIAYDILGTINNMDYYIDSRGRTETLTSDLPRYFLFSIQYNFNTKKKK